MKIGVKVPANSELWKNAIAGLAGRFPSVSFEFGEDAVARSLGEFEALIASRLSEEELARADSLRALFLPITGLNAVPAAALARRGIRVFNVHANAESVAQNALAMTLAWFGRLIDYHNDLRRGVWHGFWVGKGAEDEWDSVWGSKVCVLGTGAIGAAVASLFKAFRCEVTGWRKDPGKGLPAGFDRVEASLRAAVAGKDIVVGALPLTDSTRGVVDAAVFESMRGAFFVNVGRGLTVDEEALWKALRDRVIAGAGIDVWYRYPAPGEVSGSPSQYPIHELPNVVLSPHVGGSTRQATRRAVEDIASSLASWLETGAAPAEVDLRAGY